MEINKQRQYNPAVDILRVIAILAVVLIHTTTRTLEVSIFDLQRMSWSLMLNQFSRFAVPLFFIISGFVLELNYSFHSGYFSYLKKRVRRLLIPYVIWSAIYYYFVYTNHTRSLFSALLDGSSSYQLYFIPSLLLFYTFFPFVHKFYNFFANKWMLIILGIVQLILLYREYYVSPFILTYPVKMVILNYYPFILGAVFSRNRDFLIRFVEKWKALLITATAVLGSWVFLEGKNLYLSTKNYLYFYSQWRPSVFLYTLSLGLTIYYFLNEKQKIDPFIKKLSELSFFVFFIHVIVLEFLWAKVGIQVFQGNKHIIEQIWFDPAFFLAVSGMSFFIAYLAHKVPLLSKLTA
jgi:probable poly-beta-1,6-N-acetyl-D-glucosamine export protein